MAQAAPAFMAGSMGLQAIGGAYQISQMRKAQQVEAEEAIRNIEHLKYQEGLSESATAANDVEAEEQKLRFLDQQSHAISGAGFSGGATAEALSDEASVKMNAAQRLARMKGNMQSMMIRERAKGVATTAGHRMRAMRGQAIGTLLGTVGGIMGTGAQWGMAQAKSTSVRQYYPQA